MEDKKKTLYAEKGVFEKLRKINVSGLIQKKNGLDYIPWATALEILLREDPDANFSFGEPMRFGEGENQTVMVFCTVTCHGKSMTCHLPVQNTNGRPYAIKTPDAFQVNTAMMRCLAKAIALHGLGLQLYVNEDLRNLDFIELMEGEKQQAQQQRNEPPGLNLDEAIIRLRQAGSMDELRGVFADAYRRGNKEQKAAVKKVYDEIKEIIERRKE